MSLGGVLELEGGDTRWKSPSLARRVKPWACGPWTPFCLKSWGPPTPPPRPLVYLPRALTSSSQPSRWPG